MQKPGASRIYKIMRFKCRIFKPQWQMQGQESLNLRSFSLKTRPAIIAKPVNFVLNTVLGGTLNIIKNLPAAIQTEFQTIQQKLADISDKLTAMMGELKASIEKKISETFNELKKKVKSLFAIFSPLDAENEDKQIDETKKTFELRTFIHELYKKLTENEKDLEDNGHL